MFIGPNQGAGLSNMAMTSVLRRMGHGDITVHGMRSTFRDWAAECTNYPNHVVEMALAHVVGDKVEAAYRRGDLLAKRKQLAEAWARYCTSPPWLLRRWCRCARAHQYEVRHHHPEPRRSCTHATSIIETGPVWP